MYRLSGPCYLMMQVTSSTASTLFTWVMKGIRPEKSGSSNSQTFALLISFTTRDTTDSFRTKNERNRKIYILDEKKQNSQFWTKFGGK